MSHSNRSIGAAALALAAFLSTTTDAAQAPRAATAAAPHAAGPTAGAPGLATPPDFVLGPSDVISVVFWREKDLSGDVVIRPDGQISLPLLNDVHAAGLTPEQLRQRITEASAKFIDDPTVTVVVKEINSRRVFITGQVAKPGPYGLTGPTTVLQLIAMAGGVLEYSDSKHISVMRVEGGRARNFAFNYKDVMRGKNLRQNIELKPGDTVMVP